MATQTQVPAVSEEDQAADQQLRQLPDLFADEPEIDDFVAQIPDYLDIIDSAWDGRAGIRCPGAKGYLAE